MFIGSLANSRAYFKTLSGKVYPASKWRLYFLDRDLEAKYLSWLLERYYETFQWTCYCTALWTVVVVSLYAALKFWYDEMLVFVGAGGVVVPLMLWCGAKLIRSPLKRQ